MTHSFFDYGGVVRTPHPSDEFIIYHIKPTGLSTVLTLDVRPKVRTIHMLGGGLRTHAVALSLPYTVIVLDLSTWNGTYGFRGAYALYRTQPLSSTNDLLYRCNLPNILFGEQVCMGDTADLQRALFSAPSLLACAQAFLADFWGRPFSDHALWHFRDSHRLHPAFGSLASWQDASRRDPGFILRVPWEPVGTLAATLQTLGGGFSL
jgi:hypothetical protein